MENVLGISLGTRALGFVFLHQSELYLWGIKTYKGKWSAKKLKRILRTIDTIVELNGIEIVAIKIPDTLPISKGFMQLIGSLNVFFEQKRIPTRYFTLSDVKQRYCGSPKVNKQQLVTHLLEKYPDLLTVAKRTSKGKSYYVKIYEAFAAARFLS